MRCLGRAFQTAITKQFLDAAWGHLHVLDVKQNVCAQLDALAEGAVVALAPGRYRWSGKLRKARGLHVVGLHGAIIKGRVQLAEGSSGTFSGVGFENDDSGAIRLQAAHWTFQNCKLECSDADGAALTAVSSKALLSNCRLLGSDTGLTTRPCWIGILAKGSACVEAIDCQIGPCVHRGAVALDQAELLIQSCKMSDCEELGLRLNCRASLIVRDTEMSDGGVVVHAGANCIGSLLIQNCRIRSFQTIWTGASRPQHLSWIDNVVLDVEQDGNTADDCKDMGDVEALL